MIVKDKIMYHYHKLNHHDSIWTPGNELTVDQNFNSHIGNVLTDFNTSVVMSDNSLQTFDRVLGYYLKDNNIEDVDKALLKQILSESKRIIGAINVYNREHALEEVRKKFFPSLPSRLHSIWVCEKSQLDFWENNLKGKLVLYKVKLNGTLFHSSDLFLPDETLTISEMMEDAKRYWTPNFKTKAEKLSSEFLFQGEVKVLEKVKETR